MIQLLFYDRQLVRASHDQFSQVIDSKIAQATKIQNKNNIQISLTLIIVKINRDASAALRPGHSE
jgi:hypothetical protein